MEKLKIHSAGPAFSRIVYGVWRWNDKEQTTKDCETLLNTCLENGIDTIDHADIYGNFSNEELFGKVIQHNTALSKQLKIVTKCGIQFNCEKRPEIRAKHYNYSAAHIVTSVENSLQNLHIEHIDLLLLHRPSPMLNADEVAETLENLVKSGKVGYVGVSNFSPSQFELLQSRLSIPLVNNQIEVNLNHLEPLTDGAIDHLYKNGIKPMVWSPLAGGSLFKGETDLSKKLKEIADKYTVDRDVMALAWLLNHPVQMIPVIGTNKSERIVKATQAVDVKFDIQDWFALYEASLGHEVA